MVNKNAFRTQIKGVSSEIVQLVHINTCLLVRYQLKLPFSHSIRSSVYQVYYSLNLSTSDSFPLD